MRKPYPDDLNDKEWEQIKPILEKVKKVQGRPPVHDRREVLNALWKLQEDRNSALWWFLEDGLSSVRLLGLIDIAD